MLNATGKYISRTSPNKCHPLFPRGPFKIFTHDNQKIERVKTIGVILHTNGSIIF